MSIHLEFALTFDDYLRSLRPHAKRNLRWRLNWILGEIILPAGGILTILYTLRLLHRDYNRLLHVPWIPFILMLAGGVFMTLYPVYLRARLRKCYKLANSALGGHIIDINDEQICVQRLSAKTEIQWSALRSFSESDKIFMFYITPMHFVAIPKRICSENQIDDLRNLFVEKIGKGEGIAVA